MLLLFWKGGGHVMLYWNLYYYYFVCLFVCVVIFFIYLLFFFPFLGSLFSFFPLPSLIHYSFPTIVNHSFLLSFPNSLFSFPITNNLSFLPSFLNSLTNTPSFLSPPTHLPPSIGQAGHADTRGRSPQFLHRQVSRMPSTASEE